MLSRFVILGTVLCSAAACGGTGSTAPDAVRGPVSSISDVRAELSRLDIAAGAVEGTTLEQMPVVGTASYEGIAAFGFGVSAAAGDAVGGAMTMNVSLADDTFSGDMDRFYGRDGTQRDGRLTISDGQIARHAGGVSLLGRVDGELEFLNEAREMEGFMVGAFGGENAEFARGDLTLQFPVDLPGSLSIPVTDLTLEGAFIVEQ